MVTSTGSTRHATVHRCDHSSGLINWLGLLLIAEFPLAILADILGRIVSIGDRLLSERVSNSSSVRLMEHAATLDLEDFEDSEFQDQLERARRQTSGRMTLMGQLLGQAQDIVTVASFAAGFIFFATWLIALLLLALVPPFLGEANSNAQSYSLLGRHSAASHLSAFELGSPVHLRCIAEFTIGNKLLGSHSYQENNVNNIHHHGDTAAHTILVIERISRAFNQR